MTALGTTSASQSMSGSRLAPGFALGEYRLGAMLFPLRIADAYKADGPKGTATVYVVHATIAANIAVRDQIIAGTRAAAALPEHKHLVKTLAAGLTGDKLWIATEEVEGSLVRDLLAKKRSAGRGNAGLGTRATANLVVGVSAGLADAAHGALADESVVVSRTGRVRVIDLALGAGTAAAIVAGLVPGGPTIAPEVLGGAGPSGAADVYSIGALLYESLVGQPLERGGPRPSEVVPGLDPQIDELVGRSCHQNPEKRFGRPDVLGEVVGEALGKGAGGTTTASVPKIDHAPIGEQPPSLAASLAPGGSGMSGQIDVALAAALADTTEKWLISKGKLDYGPFSLADVITQIEKGDIVAGNVIMDKDSGARAQVETHPLLGPMVETARQKRDDARRAQAEVAVQKSDKKRGALLYVVIGLGVVGAVLGVMLIIRAASSDKVKQVEGIDKLEGAELKVTVTMPKAPPKKARHTGGGGGGGGGGNYTKGSEDLSLDMSDEDDSGGGGGPLDMGVVYGVYSRYGGRLGGCLAKTGASSANIGIIIDGKSGRVSLVKVDGKQQGSTWACINGVMRGMQFPSTGGARTRAEFDIGI